MRKMIIIVMGLIMYQQASGEAHYRIDEGKLHRGGKALVKVLESIDLFRVTLSYHIDKKRLVPIPEKYLQGQTTIDLPSMFKDERGYLELEVKKNMDIEGAKLFHQGRVSLSKSQKDAHLVKIVLKNGKGKIDLIYHPTLAGAGWAKLELVFISNIAGLNGYTIICQLKEN